MSEKSHRYCVIMCGGIGSRFWPYSRTDLPKQFIDFFGTGRTLLQMSYRTQGKHPDTYQFNICPPCKGAAP